MATKIEPGQIRANRRGGLVYVEYEAYSGWAIIVLRPHSRIDRYRNAPASQILRSYPLVCTLEVR